MFPLFPFMAGLAAGGLAVSLWRRDDTQAGVKKAQDALAAATQTGLGVVRSTTETVRQRWAVAAEPAPAPRAARKRTKAAAAAPVKAAGAAPARKKGVARKAAAKTRSGATS